MKRHISWILAAGMASGWAIATEEATAQTHPANEQADTWSWLTPSVDLRARYEYRDIEPLETSNALTVRARLGLKAGDFGGFSIFGEFEGNYALVDDFQAGGGADPMNPGNTPINDPDNAELNRAWLQYKANGFLAKAGRQRIIRNNAAMIGNVGWRQNEQTFDAVSLAYAKDEFKLFYGYANRVQRIFGNDATGAAHEFEGDFHFIDGDIKTGFGQAGGYVYLVDVDNNANVGESTTLGGWITSGPFRVEFALQDGTTALNNKGDYDAIYGHLNYSRKLDASTFGVGLEYLESYFKTPLATVHAFNGFADAFALQRIGLNDNGGVYDGLSDMYVSYARPGLIGGATFKGIVHYFLDDSFGDSYGWEIDAVLVRKFGDRLTGLIKAAFFFENDVDGGYQDISQVSVQFDYKF
jgi:hypothetical protein